MRIDISPTNPYSKYAQEQSLQNLFAMGAITLDEFIDALDDDSSIPKAKMQEILEQRKAEETNQLQFIAAENEQLKQQLNAVPQQIEQAVQIGASRQQDAITKQQTIQALQQKAAEPITPTP